MELVPGGMHVTPSDGGKSRFIPHADAQLHVSTSKPDNFLLRSSAPSEGTPVFDNVFGDRSTGPRVVTGISSWNAQATSMRDEHDDPAHLLDREHDTRLPKDGVHEPDGHWRRDIATTGDSPRTYYTPYVGPESADSYETLNLLPHLGGDPKSPATALSINLGQKSRMSSEDVDALRGLHRSYSHLYDVEDPEDPRISVGPAALRRGPVRARDRHVFPVFVNDDENSTAYMYNTVNGQITKDFFED